MLQYSKRITECILFHAPLLIQGWLLQCLELSIAVFQEQYNEIAKDKCLGHLGK